VDSPPLVGRFLVFAVAAVGLTATFTSAYTVGRVAGELLLANILLLTGIQVVHDARRGKKNRPAALGYVLAGLGVFAMLGSIADPLLARVAKQMADQRAASDAQAAQERAKIERAEEKTRWEQAAAKHKQEAAERLEKALVDIRSGDRSRMSLALTTVQTTRYYDRRAEVVTLLEPLLSHADFTVRWRAIEALGEWGSRASVPKLEPLRQNKDAIIRGAAKDAIDKIKSREPAVTDKATP
jgi:HEAT repeat protein